MSVRFRCRASVFPVLAALWCLGAGCVAVPVGRTGVFTHEKERYERDGTPRRTTAEKPRVVLLQQGNTVEVSLTADVVKEYLRVRSVRKTTVRRQRRLAFGLFPGAAEFVWMPDGALVSAMGLARSAYDQEPRYCGYYHPGAPGLGNYAAESAWAVFGVLPALYNTCESLLVAPFEHWECNSHDFCDPDTWRRDVTRFDPKSGKVSHVADASGSPRLRALADMPEGMRRAIGVRTCFDERSTNLAADRTHLGLVGFHKYLAVSVEVKEETEGEPELERRKERGRMGGPYEVELSIPGLGYVERRVVEKGATLATFQLPGAPHETAIEAQVSMRGCGAEGPGPAPELTRQALRGLVGQGNRFDVNLSGKKGGVAWEILHIQPSRNGKYLVRVRLQNPDGRAKAVREVASEVRRRIREDYANRHPSVRVDEVRDVIRWQAAPDDPSILSFVGWAFSAAPLGEGWHWDAGTRRGRVRVWVSGNVPEEHARQWVRDNVSAIVADKGVVLEAGGRTPGGAGFECISERFENGVFTVEFKLAEP